VTDPRDNTSLEIVNLISMGKRYIEDYIEAKIGWILPASPTFNSDVETFHRLVEDEFYSIEDIQDGILHVSRLQTSTWV